jgi:hypothetical protein
MRPLAKSRPLRMNRGVGRTAPRVLAGWPFWTASHASQRTRWSLPGSDIQSGGSPRPATGSSCILPVIEFFILDRLIRTYVKVQRLGGL